MYSRHLFPYGGLSTNLGKDFFRYLWYYDKKPNRMWFSVALVKFLWFGINWHVFNQSECRNCYLYTFIQKITPQAKSGKYFQIRFFPRFRGKNGGVLSIRMQVMLDSRFARPGSAPIRGGKKGEFWDWTLCLAVPDSISPRFVNSQLASFSPAGIFNSSCLICNICLLISVSHLVQRC